MNNREKINELEKELNILRKRYVGENEEQRKITMTDANIIKSRITALKKGLGQK